MNRILFSLALISVVSTIKAQTEIKVLNEGVTLSNTGNQTPEASSVFDVSSNSKGVIFPRLLQAQIDQIINPAEGLLVYNLDKHRYEYWNGSAWLEMGIAPIPPMAPTDLIAVSYTGSTVDLTWTDNSDDEIGFRILRSETTGNGFIEVGSVDADITTFRDSGLNLNTTYYYTVLARGNSNSDSSNEASVITPNAFASSWETSNVNMGSSSAQQVKLPLTSTGTYDFYVDWGDSSDIDRITSWDQAEVTHTYNSPGTYNINVAGTCVGWKFQIDASDNLKIIDISNWGNISFNQERIFYNCSNLDVSATDSPTILTTNLESSFYGCSSLRKGLANWDVSGVQEFANMFNGCTVYDENLSSWNVNSATTMTQMFANAIAFNGNIISWSVSNVATFQGMFLNAQSFNRDISSWNVSSAINMNEMFKKASSFDQPIGGWGLSTGLVSNMSEMFEDAISFDQNLSAWDVSSVTNMQQMFDGAEIYNNGNSSLEWNANTSSVTNMSYMFRQAYLFNQPLNSWNVSNVVGAGFNSMFQNATSFNQDLNSWIINSGINQFINMFNGASSFNGAVNNWNVSNVTHFNNMFFGTSFNKSLDLWNMSNAMTLANMFRDTPFNQDISGWNISNVTNMNETFRENTAFNQDLSSWNTSSVTQMIGTFFGATAFDGNISSWDISNVTSMSSLFAGVTLNTATYDTILNSWSTQSVQPNVFLTGGGANYTISASQAARDVLTNSPNNWTITDAGGI